MLDHPKVIDYEKISSVSKEEQDNGNKIVHCHGTFDLIHPGHVIHFEEAKALGDKLVVTITGEKYVNKGPGRPFFNDSLRAKSLTALECIDYVVIIPYPAAVEAIKAVSANIYCKGKEYENTSNDVTGNMLDDVKAVEEVGGVLRYVGSVVFSSTKLLNGNFSTHSPEVKKCCEEIARNYTPAKIREIVDSFSDLKVLVIGDTIFDEYETATVQGLTSKNRILSGRYLYEDRQAGGALAVFRHIQSFTPHVKLISLVGKEPWVDDTLSLYFEDDQDLLVRSEDFTTIRKRRVVEPWKEGSELNKLFSVNYIDEGNPSQQTEQKVLDTIQENINDFDLVLVMDFGHGVMTEKVRNLVQDKAPFLAVNCQTNSNNFGYNIINRQYKRADSFSLDESEIKLACGQKKPDFHIELEKLKTGFASKYAWLTRGAVETIGLHQKEKNNCPPLENEVVDPVGAGDAFCAISSMAAVKEIPIDLSTYLGQMAGAQAVKIIGNTDAINKGSFLKAAQTMINF